MQYARRRRDLITASPEPEWVSRRSVMTRLAVGATAVAGVALATDMTPAGTGVAAGPPRQNGDLTTIGSLTTVTGLWVPRSDLTPDGELTVVWQDYDPAATTPLLAQLVVDRTASFTGGSPAETHVNPVVFLGWNVAGGGARIDPNLGSAHLAIEGDYWNDQGGVWHHANEIHLQFDFPGMSSPWRVLTAKSQWADRIVDVSLQGRSLKLTDATGAVVFGWNASGALQATRNMQIAATSGASQVAIGSYADAANLLLLAKSDNAGRIQFQTESGNRWQIVCQHAISDRIAFFCDATERFHALWTPGPAGAAISLFYDRVQIRKGTGSQTANLQEWQDETGTTLSRVDSNGVYVGPVNPTMFTDPASARAGLGLGDSAIRNIGTSSTEIAAGNRGIPPGGTTGQVLAKQSDADYDAAWATPMATGVVMSHGLIATTTSDSSTAWTMVGGSKVPITAGKTYRIRWMLRAWSAAGSTGLRLRRALGDDATATIHGVHYLGMASGVAAIAQSSREDHNDQLLGLGNATSSTIASGSWTVEALLTCTTSGTIGLECQSEVSASQITISDDGSYWVAEEWVSG